MWLIVFDIEMFVLVVGEGRLGIIRMYLYVSVFSIYCFFSKRLWNIYF